MHISLTCDLCSQILSSLPYCSYNFLITDVYTYASNSEATNTYKESLNKEILTYIGQKNSHTHARTHPRTHARTHVRTHTHTHTKHLSHIGRHAWTHFHVWRTRGASLQSTAAVRWRSNQRRTLTSWQEASWQGRGTPRCQHRKQGTPPYRDGGNSI